MIRVVGLAFALLLVAGCVTVPKRSDADLEIDTPADWTAVEAVPEGEARGKWWTEFGDDSLDALIERAIEKNRDLMAAAARVEQAAATARIAGADIKPSIGVGLDYSTSKQVFPGFSDPAGGGGLFSSRFKQAGVSLDLSWEIDLWGRLRAGARAALAELSATEADRYGLELSIAGQTAKAWFAITEAHEQVELARRSAESFRRLSERIRARYEMGVRPATDLRLALSNLARAEAAAELRGRQLDRTIRQLEILLGRYPDRSILEEFPLESLRATPPPVPAGLPSDLVGRRPDLVAAERRLTSGDQRLLAAKRALYPRLTLTGSAGTTSNQLGDLVNGDFSVWSLAAGLVQPIFQGGKLRADVDRNRATAEELLQRYASAALRAYSEVETALAADEFLREEERHLSTDARQLIAAERLAEERYRVGVGGYLTLLEAQTRLFTSQSELLTTRRRRLENRVDLHLALGGGFDPGEAGGTLAALQDDSGDSE